MNSHLFPAKKKEREKRGNVMLLPTAANDKRSILPAVTASLQNRPQRLPLLTVTPLYSSLLHCTRRICSQQNTVKAVIWKYVTYAISDIKLQIQWLWPPSGHALSLSFLDHSPWKNPCCDTATHRKDLLANNWRSPANSHVRGLKFPSLSQIWDCNPRPITWL